MIRPLNLLEAVSSALDIYGDGTKDDDGFSIVDFVVTLVAINDFDDDTFWDWVADGKTSEEIFDGLDKSLETTEIFLELKDAAANSFTYGEIYDALADRILPMIEATA
jgi:hypothetical protein